MASKCSVPPVPDSFGVFIPGESGRIFSQIYTPGSDGPSPVVILCHGFPGNERLLDFAVYLREQGFCTVSFHYRGSWGSDGSYSLHGGMADADAVIDYVLSNPGGFFDTSRISILGYSWGATVTAHMLKTRQELHSGILLMPCDMKNLTEKLFLDPAVVDLFSEGCEWLRDFSCSQMISEVAADPEQFSIPACAPAICGKNVLIANGVYDTLFTYEDNVLPLADAVRRLGGAALTVRTLETDHGLNINRSTVKDMVAEFLRQ